MAFASSTAHEHRAAPGEHLCVEYLFYHSVAGTPGKTPCCGTTMAAVAAALQQEGQPVETAWPYGPDQPVSWVLPAISSKLHRTTMVNGKLAFEGIIAALDGGIPVILGLVVTDAFYRPGRDGLVADVRPDAERAGHAVLAVGHGVQGKDTRALLVRNSWGEAWGLGGHAWLSSTYVERHLHETAMLP